MHGSSQIISIFTRCSRDGGRQFLMTICLLPFLLFGTGSIDQHLTPDMNYVYASNLGNQNVFLYRIMLLLNDYCGT